jgi:hypothetical protein
LNNPLKYTDPTGQLYVLDDYGLDKLTGKITHLRDTYDNFDRLIAFDENGSRTDKSITVPKNNYKDKSFLFDLWKTGKGVEGSYAISNSPEAMGDVFLFAAQNSVVEWAFDGFSLNGKNEYVMYSDHTDKIKVEAAKWQRFEGKERLFDIHSHYTTDMNYRKASGYGQDVYYGDMATITRTYNSTGKIPNSYIYHPYSESLIKYTPWNPQSNIKTGVTYPGGLLFLYKK